MATLRPLSSWSRNSAAVNLPVGDASATRDRSLVLYPALRPQLGRILAAQFGFRAQPTDSSEAFLVLLGRDAPNRTAQNRG